MPTRGLSTPAHHGPSAPDERQPAPLMVVVAQKAMIIEAGRLLTIRKAHTDPHQPGRWDLPGGRLTDTDSGPRRRATA